MPEPARPSPSAVLDAPEAESAVAAPAQEATRSPIDRLLEQVVDVRPGPAPALLSRPAEPSRIALLRGLGWVTPGELEVSVRPGAPAFRAAVAAELDREFLSDAIRDGQLLLAEWPEGGAPTVVGVVQTRAPSKLRIQAEEIELDAERELLLRSGSAALRLRASGDVELVGSRISAVSRGVMRLIGRLLRLN
jgi:hypothetical protein